VNWHLIIRAVHLAAMAIWLGGPIVATVDIKRAQSLGTKHIFALAGRMRRLTPLMIIAGLVTVVSGLGLMAEAGGWAHMPNRLQLGLALTVSTFFIGGTVIAPALLELTRMDKEPPGEGRTRRIFRRFVVAHWVEIVIRGVVFALMVYPFKF
jgi:hypothetical protein